MDEPVISKFYTNYYLRAICGGIIFICFTGRMLYASLFVNLVNPVGVRLFTIFLLGLLYVYFYFFSKSWKRITVTPTEIIVYDVVFKKQLTIPYTDITRTAIHQSTEGYSIGVFAENLVIEFKGDQSITIDAGHYSNYSRLKMAIYNYTIGPGRGRERYLARREREE